MPTRKKKAPPTTPPLLPLESTRDWGCGGVKKLAARNSKGSGGSFVRHLNRPWHLFDSFFGRVARYGPVSVALLSIVQKKRFTPFSLQAKSMGAKICMFFLSARTGLQVFKSRRFITPSSRRECEQVKINVRRATLARLSVSGRILLN